jgi:hypothetical protein
MRYIPIGRNGQCRSSRIILSYPCPRLSSVPATIEQRVSDLAMWGLQPSVKRRTLAFMLLNRGASVRDEASKGQN